MGMSSGGGGGGGAGLSATMEEAGSEKLQNIKEKRSRAEEESCRMSFDGGA